MPVLEESSAKKQKLASPSEPPQTKAPARPSKIFSPFRSVGNVTDATPLAVTSLGQSFVVTTSVGNFFQIYDATSLHLLFVSSPRTPSPITALYSHFHFVFAAWGSTIGIFKRGRLQTSLSLDPSVDIDGPISSLVLFGEHLCAVTETAISVFKVNPKNPAEDPELYTIINIPKSFGKIKQIFHPHTYLNKVAVVVDSSILLYNVRTGRLLFSSDPASSPITTVEPSPVLDMVGVGTAAGDIHLYHLKQGRILFTLNAGSRITTMSFRTDGTPLLGVGTAAGDLIFYHLNTKKRIHILRGAHKEANGGVSRIHFFNGQPIFITNGGDNKLAEYVFDPSVITGNDEQAKASVASISAPRLLRSRGGHSLPPTFISFTDEEAHFILSGSRDQSLWSFSLRKDAQSYEFSQKEKRTVNGGPARGGILGSMQNKFPEITGLAYQKNKQGRWDNILTAHKDLTFAHTWDGKRGIVGPYHLPTIDGGIVKTVYISSCGNFGIIGSSLGGVGVYNLQSGALRKQYTGHTQSVTGAALDSLNTTLITSALDGQVRIYDFHKKTNTGSINVVQKLQLAAPITTLLLHEGSDLLAVALDNLSIVVIDIRTRKVVRELWGHSNRITSFDFSPDGRWIISASLDGTIRTWDLPTGGCIDVVKVDNVVTCLRMSPNGDWLATAHVRGVGVSLWTNRAQFRNISAKIITEEDEKEKGISTIEMPNVAGEGGANIIDGAFDEEEEDDEDSLTTYTTVEQLSEDLITLSLLPRSKFNTLTHLEAIKKRNKAKEAPKKPENLPFFLGMTKEGKSEAARIGPSSVADASVSASVEATGTTTKQSDEDSAIYLRAGEKIEFESKFTRLLKDEANPVAFIAHLKTLSPAGTDLELRALKSYAPLEEIILFVRALTAALHTHKDYELVQAWMSMLLRIHGDVILAHSTKKTKKSKSSNTEEDADDDDDLLISRKIDSDSEDEEDEEEEEDNEWTVYLPELVEALEQWEKVQSAESARLGELAQYCSGVINFLKIA